MKLDIRNIPSEASRWTVKRAIAAVLHSNDFRTSPEAGERPTNFDVLLNDSPMGGVRNNGSGTLTLPTYDMGRQFAYFVQKNPIKIDGQQLKFYKTEERVPLHVAMTLEKTPYINPDQEEKRQQKLYDLEEQLRVDEVQFGVFYRSYPKVKSTTAPPRAFSVECKLNFATKSLGWLHFDYDHKFIRVELGDRMTEQIGKSILVQFATISKMAVGYDTGNPFIIFDTLTPPVLEEIDFNRPITGNDAEDSKRCRRRIGWLHPDHAIAAPYAHQLRILLYNDRNVDVVDTFTNLCDAADLTIPLNCMKSRISIDASRREFFTRKKMHQVRLWLKKLNWSVAFQLEAMLCSARLNTDELLVDLYPLINQLCQNHPHTAGNVLRLFGQALDARLPQESPVECFERTRDRTANAPRTQLYPGFFYCHHVTFTPTRLILEGPYATQSNRVIRRYEGYEEHFLRVDFREEDRLHFHWTREVDATSFLNERVGGILKGGFEIAGRRFEFLAYSSSALRQHAVWFMHPFQVGNTKVDSASIRKSLGDFTLVRKQPSKYAARMAQAFTATDPSVTIRRDEWDVIPDIKEFTDGVGTISKELSDRIWDALCASRGDRRGHTIKPSVYQIRFLGFKGVVGVDERLEGSKMHLRPSMKKFKTKEEDDNADAPIEIARAFEYPNASYLNRAMIMILEDRGVRTESFLDLQQAATAEARMVDDSLERFRNLLRCHNLGNKFGLSRIMERLDILGLDLTDHNGSMVINNPFLAQTRKVAMNHVLRELKHRARIPVPESYQLVGVADEGHAYIAKGLKNVYTLPFGKIYACIQNPGDPEPTWLKGVCMISRNPVVHPGDVQRVFAIGKPPKDQICLFGHMKNVVVFSTEGNRPLPSCLGGGDLDGDTYDIVLYKPLLPSVHVDPGTYDTAGVRELDRESEIEDICDFIVEYILSDVLGLLSDRHLIIADQSKHGTMDRDCLTLAALCSQAVDYPKNGVAVNIDENPLPSLLIRCKPDWHAAEATMPRQTDYYMSTRALGHLYRAIEIEDPSIIHPAQAQEHLTDAISVTLMPLVQRHVLGHLDSDSHSSEIKPLFQRYIDELQYICATYALRSTAKLEEAEVVMGTILAKCNQQRWRKDKIYRMQEHTSVLVQSIRHDFEGHCDPTSSTELSLALERAWCAWDFSLRKNGEFGSNSFGLIALGVILNLLDKVGEIVCNDVVDM